MRHKDAGTVMTVVVASEELAFCEWSEAGAKQHQVFRHSQLERLEPPPPAPPLESQPG